MRLHSLWLAICLSLLPTASTWTSPAHFGRGAVAVTGRARVRCVFGRRNRNVDAEKAQYEKLAQVREQQEKERMQRLEREKKARDKVEREKREREAAYQDNVDLYRPGGVMRPIKGGVTREMLLNSRKTTSPAIQAEERVKEAMETVNTMPPVEAAKLLENLVAQAKTSGVGDYSPTLKKAISLKATLELASGSAAATKKAKREALDADGPQDVFDALFGGGYVIPDDDDMPPPI